MDHGYNIGFELLMDTFFTSSFPVIDSLQSQGIESLKRLLHSSSDDEDDFSELGAPVQQGVGKQLKLVTQKPEPYGVCKLQAMC